MFSGQGADCWNLVDGMGRLGWTPDQMPLVLSGSCIDFDAMRAAGDLAKGIYIVGAPGAVLNPIDSIEDPRDKFEATIYQTKLIEYGLDETELNKGFATQGATGLLSLWEYASKIVADGGEVTGAALGEAYASSAGDHLFGSTPLSCSTAPAAVRRGLQLARSAPRSGTARSSSPSVTASRSRPGRRYRAEARSRRLIPRTSPDRHPSGVGQGVRVHVRTTVARSGRPARATVPLVLGSR